MVIPPTFPIGSLFGSLLMTGKAIGKICDFCGEMPNIDFPTLGGHVFWRTLAVNDGWKLQKNKLTGHCRVLDPGDVRRAWGSEYALYQLLIDLSKSAARK